MKNVCVGVCVYMCVGVYVCVGVCVCGGCMCGCVSGMLNEQESLEIPRTVFEDFISRRCSNKVRTPLRHDDS